MKRATGHNKGPLLDDDELPEVEAAPDPDDTDLKRIANLAARQLDLEREIHDAEQQLTGLREQHKEIAERDLPLAMAEIGMEHFGMKGGFAVDLTVFQYCGITEPNKPAAFQWLRDQGDGSESIIKRQVTIQFGMKQGSDADKLVNWLQRRFPKHKITDKESVAPPTLGKYVREKTKKGVMMPEDVFGIGLKTTTVITPPKPQED